MASEIDVPEPDPMAKYEAFETRVEEEIDRTVKEAQDLAKSRVPVDTGALRDDISVDLDQDKIYNTLEYSIYQNFGTSHGVPATWYMTDSALDAFNNSIDRLTQ